MAGKRSALTPVEAKRYYDRFGDKLDSQGFYENPALDALVVPAAFEKARNVFEFGCGTGRYAARLLAEHLPSRSRYIGCDISPVMVALASGKLAAYSDRAQVIQSDGAIRFPLPDESVDRVVSSYVLDLLADDDIRTLFDEAHRVLVPRGRLCLTSLTRGTTVPSRIVTALWSVTFRICPSLLGGCRPIRFDPFMDRNRWEVAYRRVVVPYGIPSEAIVLIRV